MVSGVATPNKRMEPTPASAAPRLGTKRGEIWAGGVAPGSVTRAAPASPQRSCQCLARLIREALAVAAETRRRRDRFGLGNTTRDLEHTGHFQR